jgi:lipopolysaccharide heptosyltransferase I
MRLVLIRLSAIGDIVHTWPLACALRDADIRSHITWVVEAPLQPLVEGHPAVDAVLTTRTRYWRRHPFSAATRAEIGKLRSSFHELQPDITLDPQGVLKSAVVTRWTGGARRIGLARPWRRELLAGCAYTESTPGAPGRAHVTETNLEMVRALGLTPPDTALPDGSWLLQRVADKRPEGPWAAPYAVILPGTAGAHKFIPTATLAEVGRGITTLGMDVVVAWGPGEEERARKVTVGAGSGVYLAPPTGLEALVALLGDASLVVGGDTGPSHLAASFGVPTVAVFLASDWRRNGPLGARTAVVSGAARSPEGPSGSARLPSRRAVGAQEIIDAACNLIDV